MTIFSTADARFQSVRSGVSVWVSDADHLSGAGRLASDRFPANYFIISLCWGQGGRMKARWVLAQSGRAHLDIGDRSSQSLRVQAEHVIITACHAHIDADASVVSEAHAPLCSNCVRISRQI